MMTIKEVAMPIYQTAHYQVEADSVPRVKAAIEEFVRYVDETEAGSKVYAAWQAKDDPTRFCHVFIFRDEEAQRVHGESDAVRKFEEVYSPELVGGPVVFTDYVEVASNRGGRAWQMRTRSGHAPTRQAGSDS